jgi:LuxR family maltose regulon positive regulatory protein
MYVGMSELHRERDDLPAATRCCCRARSWASTSGCRRTRIAGGSRWRGYGRLKEIWGGALDLLNEAERLYVGDFFPNVRPIPALRARVRVAQASWVKRSAGPVSEVLSFDDDLSYLREFEHITLVRVLLARDAGERASAPYRRRPGSWKGLLRAAEEGQRTASVIEILVLQALTRQAQRRHPRCACVTATAP